MSRKFFRFCAKGLGDLLNDRLFKIPDGSKSMSVNISAGNWVFVFLLISLNHIYMG